MKADAVAQRLRRFLLAVTGAVFIGTPVELWFTEHTESLLQLVPFFLCGVGLGVVIAAWVAPRRNVLLLLRVVMGVILLGGFLGIYEHVEHNIAFELEIRPNATTGDVLWKALSGASPLLAPGILTLAALLALAATYAHPALHTPRAE